MINLAQNNEIPHDPSLEVRETELDFPVDTSRTQQRRIQRVRPISCHEHPNLESIQATHCAIPKPVLDNAYFYLAGMSVLCCTFTE